MCVCVCVCVYGSFSASGQVKPAHPAIDLGAGRVEKAVCVCVCVCGLPVQSYVRSCTLDVCMCSGRSVYDA